MKENQQIIQPIGEGSFGKVFKARRKQTGQIVAMKFITKKGRSDKDMNNLRQEIAILKGLRHPNIILLLDSFETEHEFCLVTEFAHGELFEILEDDKNLPEKEVRKIAQQLVKSLNQLHSNRIIHRDLKPQNILFGSNGIIKICDFGFARSMSRNTMVLQSIKGTPLYMAPELINDNSNGYNHAVDLWSLGVILQELFVGQPPFQATSLIQLAKLIVNEKVKQTPSMSPEFKNFLTGLLNKNPNERMNWPRLFEHPFIRETHEEKIERSKLEENFTVWLESGVFQSNLAFELEMEKIVENAPRNNDKSRQEQLNGSMWSNYELQTQEETGATQLRADRQFLDRLIRLYSVQPDELERKDIRLQHNTSVRVLCGMMNKSKAEGLEDDIATDTTLHSAIVQLIKNLLETDTPAPELLSDLVRVIGFLLKGTFNRSDGVQFKHKLVEFMLNEMQKLMNQPDGASPHVLLQINTVKTISIFVHQAGCSPLKSKELFNQVLYRQLYKDMITIIATTKYASPGSLHRACVHALAVMLHVNQGDYLFNFPWKSKNISLDQQIADWVTVQMEKVEKIKKNIWSTLIEVLGDEWLAVLVTVGNSDEEQSSPCKLSALRILLHLVRCQRVTTKDILESPSLRTNFVDQLIKPILTKSIDYSLLGTTYTLLSTMIRQCSSSRGNTELVDEFLRAIEFDLNMLWDALEGLLSKEPVVSELCCMLMSEIIASANRYKQIVFNKFSGAQSKNFSLINELLVVEHRVEKPSKRSKQPAKQITKQDEIKKIEGSNFGCPVFGFHDGPVLLLSKLWGKSVSNEFTNPNDFYMQLRQNKIIESLFLLLRAINNKGDLSPRGVISLFTLLYDLIMQDTNNLLKLLFADGTYKVIAQFLQETLIKSIIDWPEIQGGGSNIAGIVVAQVIRILNVPQSKQDIDANLVDLISREYSSYIIVMQVIQLLRYLNENYLGVAVGFLSRLVLFSDSNNKIFADQFMNQNGLRIIEKQSLLEEEKPVALSLDVLSLVSHLARLSKDQYPKIQETKVIEKCKSMIKSEDALVRSKVCNLVGNICRHSDFFYSDIQKEGLIALAMECCKDPDKNTRKFACFAVGNAGFHNDTLYDQLQPSIPQIVSLLTDEEEKTRANAAGALGNFVRNSAVLCESLISNQALVTLLEVVEQDGGPGNSPKQIALFSIGNLCVQDECKKEFEKLNIRQRIDRIKRTCTDRQIIKQADRVINKLND